MKHFINIFFLFCLFQSATVSAQIAINQDNADPDASAILDVKSTDKGLLIPRMTTEQRNNINSPATGLLIYDNNTNSFWYYAETAWIELNSGTFSALQDADNDTKIQVEKDGMDEDKIRIDLAGSERVVIEQSSTGATLINLPNNNFNTFLGNEAGQATLPSNNSTGKYNNFIGYQAGIANTTGSNNVFNGYQTGFSNTTGNSNIFNGYQTGFSNTTGNSNIFSGSLAGYFNTTGHNNVFIGSLAGYDNTTGYNNVFNGSLAGNNNTSGHNNLFTGSLAGSSNTEGYLNVFNGCLAGSSNTEGYSNVFNGALGGHSNTTGYYNVYNGYQAGFSNETGYNNLFIGRAAGYLNQDGHSNIFIGYTAGHDEMGSNKLYIENSNASTPLIYGEFDNDLVTINGSLTTTGIAYPNAGVNFPNALNPNPNYVGTAGNYLSFGHLNTSEDFLGYAANTFYFKDSNGGGDVTDPQVCAAGFGTFSSRRWKHNIKNMDNALSVIQQLQGVTYTWNKDRGHHDDFGFIAEEVHKVLPQAAQKGLDGQVESVQYGKITPYLVEAVKEQQEIIKSLEQQVENQQNTIQTLKQQMTKINELETMMRQIQANQTASDAQN